MDSASIIHQIKCLYIRMDLSMSNWNLYQEPEGLLSRL